MLEAEKVGKHTKISKDKTNLKPDCGQQCDIKVLYLSLTVHSYCCFVSKKATSLQNYIIFTL
jgi:hypothetical protein